LKNYPLIVLIGLCLLTILSLSTIGCGKKGELVRPVPIETQPIQENEEQSVSQEKSPK